MRLTSPLFSVVLSLTIMSPSSLSTDSVSVSSGSFSFSELLLVSSPAKLKHSWNTLINYWTAWISNKFSGEVRKKFQSYSEEIHNKPELTIEVEDRLASELEEWVILYELRTLVPESSHHVEGVDPTLRFYEVQSAFQQSHYSCPSYTLTEIGSFSGSDANTRISILVESSQIHFIEPYFYLNFGEIIPWIWPNQSKTKKKSSH